MQAIDVRDGRCVQVDLPAPALGPGQVRIAVEAAGVNRADLVQKSGRYPPPPGASPLLGLECAGTIAEVADDVVGWSVGDPVCALLAGGGYAGEVVVDARHVLPIPDGLDAIQAAAIVEVYATAWLNLMDLAGLADREGAKVLLHAGGSGVGTAGIQLCRAWGHRAYVTAGSGDKIARCRALGAEDGFVRHDGPWAEAAARWAPEGVDVILCPVGADYLADDVRVLGRDGTLILIGLLSGRSAQLDLGAVLVKRLRIQGSTLRARSADFKADLMGRLREHVWPRFADGTLAPIVDRTFPLHEAEAAHAHLASNTTFGAVVLTVG